MYGSEFWAVDMKIEQRISLAEMRILRWMSRVTKEDKIRNQYIRNSIEVASMVEKIRKNKLRWLGHDFRREEIQAVGLVKKMHVKRKI